MLDRIKAAFQAFRANGIFDEHGERNRIVLGSEYDFGNQKKSTGINKGFLLNSYAYSIINRIATTAADIPIDIYRILSDGTKELVEEGEFYEFIHNPNESDNYGSMLYQSMVFQLANGNSIEHFVKPIGFGTPTKRYNLFPQYISIKANEVFYGYEPAEYKYHFGSKEYKYQPEELMHVKRFNPDLNSDNPCYGLSPLTAGYRTLAASNEIQLSEASVIKNRGMTGMITSKANRPLTDDEKKWAQEALKKRIGGGEKFGQIGITSGNMDYIRFGMSPQDMQLLESGVLKLRDLCNIFGVSSRAFNDTNGATFQNVKEDEKKYYTQAVLPPLKIYLDNINRFYGDIFFNATGERYKVYCNTDSIPALQNDEKEFAEKSKLLIEGVQLVLAGISDGSWTRESGINQLIYSMDMNREEAEKLIDETIDRQNTGQAE